MNKKFNITEGPQRRGGLNTTNNITEKPDITPPQSIVSKSYEAQELEKLLEYFENMTPDQYKALYETVKKRGNI